MRGWRLFGAAGFALLAVVASQSATGLIRPLGDSRVVARIPAAPGFPEGIAVRGNTAYVATAARFGTCCTPPPGPPEVQAFNLNTGALVRRFVVAHQDPSQDHGLSGLAFDAAGRLYVLDTQWGILRFDPAIAPATIDPATMPGVIYASAFPNLPPCSPLTPAPCSPMPLDTPALPNDIVFDAAGVAYVTDSLQSTIWRIPPGGGVPQIFFQDARFNGFGANGVRLDPSRTNLVLTVTADTLARGYVYQLPLASPTAEHLTVMHTYVLAEAPDNLAFGKSGRLYVALAGSNQIGVLAPNGIELARYSGPAKSTQGNIPYDMPSGVAFDNDAKALLVNNHSEVLGLVLPERFAVFDVFVQDRADPLNEPPLP